MDKSRLIEATAEKTAPAESGSALRREDVERVLDALFGTVEHPGTIAEALAGGESVLLGSFGGFDRADGTASFRPGKALTEYLQGATR
ncbi:HU family DNA-binding protein [Streptomyces sp. NPDC054887]